MSKSLRTLTGLLLLTAALTGCHSHDTTSLLFVQVADGGHMLADDDGDGWHKLVLEDVSPSLIYFSDRPDRISGTTSLDAFLEDWHAGPESFDVDPPNAAMASIGQTTIDVVEIRDPVLEGTTLTYQARILMESEGFAPTEAVANLDPGALGGVVLFIDNLTLHKHDPVNQRDDFGKRKHIRKVPARRRLPRR